MVDSFKLTSYFATPCNPASITDYVDVYVSDGVTKTFQLVNKIATRLARVIQAGDVFYSLDLGQFTKDLVNNRFTLNSAPPFGTIVIAPGINRVSAWAFNTAVVEGDLTPYQKTYPFYLAPEVSTLIRSYAYESLPSMSAIRVRLTDLDPGHGALRSWLDWAPALPDGSPGTWVAGSADLSMSDIWAQGFMTTQLLMSGTTFNVADMNNIGNGADFVDAVGGYLILDPGTPLEEQVKLMNQTGNTLTVSPAAFTHEPGAYVYDFGRKYWLRTQFLTVPPSTPTNLDNIVIDVAAAAKCRT